MNIPDKERLFLERIAGHRGILYKISRVYETHPADQQDLQQEMFLQLWLSFDSFRGESAFSSWMYRVALNTAISFVRKKNRDSEFVGVSPYADLPEELTEAKGEEEQLAVLYNAVQRLNRLEKALVVLYLEGHSGKTMADTLGLSEANTRVKLTRTKEKLKYIIKTSGYVF